MGVDAHGGPVIDPTANVLALVEAANRRQDDLREMNNARIDAELRNQEMIADLRAKHQEALDALEAKRLDAVRNVDQLAAKTEADRSAQATAALAANSNNTAVTLRSTVDTSAQALASQFTNTVAGLSERIAALEKSSYTGQGKQQVADPMMEQLIGEMRALTAQRAADMGKAAVVDPRLAELMADVRTNTARLQAGAGKTEGMDSTWKMIIAAIGLLVALQSLGIFNRAAPQVIYSPAPAGALLPTTPPQPTPR